MLICYMYDLITLLQGSAGRAELGQHYNYSTSARSRLQSLDSNFQTCFESLSIREVSEKYQSTFGGKVITFGGQLYL